MKKAGGQKKSYTTIHLRENFDFAGYLRRAQEDCLGKVLVVGVVWYLVWCKTLGTEFIVKAF
jgi:hypothetical protein